MLPEATAKTGYCVFSTNCEPYQNPKTADINRIIINAVLKYSLFQSFWSDATAKVLPSISEMFLMI